MAVSGFVSRSKIAFPRAEKTCAQCSTTASSNEAKWLKIVRLDTPALRASPVAVSSLNSPPSMVASMAASMASLDEDAVRGMRRTFTYEDGTRRLH